MNTSIEKAIAKITNPFFILEVGIEEYIAYCKKISRIVIKVGDRHAVTYGFSTEQDCCIYISSIIEVIADCAEYKKASIKYYWDRLNTLVKILSNILNSDYEVYTKGKIEYKKFCEE